MAIDLRVVLPNRPGSLLGALQALAAVGLNVDGTCGDLRPGETWGYLHVLVEDGVAARAAIEEAGYEVAGEHEVEVIDLEDRPGAAMDEVRRHSEVGDNIEVFYLGTRTRLVLGTENMRADRPGVKMKDSRYS